MGKENEWVDRNINLQLFSHRIHKFFEDDGFPEIKTHEDPNGTWYEIQARKAGIMRTLGSSRKAIRVVIRGTPNNFAVEMGVGEWGKNLAMAALLTGGIGLVGLGFDAKFQNKLWKYIKESVEFLSETKESGATQNKPLSGDNSRTGDNLQTTNLGKRFCIGCGTKLTPDAKFCASCGKEQPPQ